MDSNNANYHRNLPSQIFLFLAITSIRTIRIQYHCACVERNSERTGMLASQYLGPSLWNLKLQFSKKILNSSLENYSTENIFRLENILRGKNILWRRNLVYIYLVILTSHFLWYLSFDSINICFLFRPKYLILSSPLLLIMKPQKIDQLKWVCSKRLYFFEVGGHNNVGTQIPIVFQMSWLRKTNFLT